MPARLGILWRALFLASSWTWCIGMWFPVYMAEDWGWPGWCAFLVPNAIGAALVGFVHSAESSRRFVAVNLAALRAFSVVTILFHVSWLAWLLTDLAARSDVGQGWIGGAAAAAAVLVGVALSGLRRWAIPSILVYAISIAVVVLIWRSGPTLRVPADSGAQAARDLWFAIPTLVLGFGLCPHLDLTFHRVRQEAPGLAGAAAFALSFGVLFPVLMVFTLLYAGGLLANMWSLYLPLHFGAQAAFTIGAHLRELRPGGLGEWWERKAVEEVETVAEATVPPKAVEEVGTGGTPIPPRGGRWGGGAMTAGIVLMFASAALPWVPAYHGTSATRLVYELLISCYALAFPAFVWIVSIERPAPRAARVRLWIVACLLAAPCLWLGYIERRYIWLAPAMGIVLIAPIATRFVARKTPARSRV